MRFLLLVIPAKRERYEAGEMPSVELVTAMSKFNQELANAGMLLSLDGLHPSAKGARIQFSGAKGVVSDGPFAESKELIGGFWMIQAASRNEALSWATRAPMEDGDIIELRQVYDMSDFPSELQDVAAIEFDRS